MGFTFELKDVEIVPTRTVSRNLNIEEYFHKSYDFILKIARLKSKWTIYLYMYMENAEHSIKKEKKMFEISSDCCQERHNNSCRQATAFG